MLHVCSPSPRAVGARRARRLSDEPHPARARAAHEQTVDSTAPVARELHDDSAFQALERVAERRPEHDGVAEPTCEGEAGVARRDAVARAQLLAVELAGELRELAGSTRGCCFARSLH